MTRATAELVLARPDFFTAEAWYQAMAYLLSLGAPA